MDKFKIIIVEDVPLELKGTEGIIKSDIPEAEIIGTADSDTAYWRLIKQQLPELVLRIGRLHHRRCGDLPADQRAVSTSEGAHLHR